MWCVLCLCLCGQFAGIYRQGACCKVIQYTKCTSVSLLRTATAFRKGGALYEYCTVGVGGIRRLLLVRTPARYTKQYCVVLYCIRRHVVLLPCWCIGLVAVPRIAVLCFCCCCCCWVVLRVRILTQDQLSVSPCTGIYDLRHIFRKYVLCEKIWGFDACLVVVGDALLYR